MGPERHGLIHVYTGDGKGKTSAALGLAMRAAGHGWRTYMGQFLKGQEYGELETAKLLGDRLTIEQYGKLSFIRAGKATPEDARLAQEGLARACQAMLGSEYDIVILDEINVALFFDLLTVEDVLSAIDQKPDDVELVLTGRRVPQEILSRADYVTVMQEVKHPYQQGTAAREGIEF